MKEKDFLKDIISDDIIESGDYEKLIHWFDKFLDNVFGSIQEGISILDKNLNIIGTNPVMDKWYEHKKPYIGKKCYSVYHDRDKPCINCPTIKAIKSETSRVDTISYRNANGTKGWHELFSFPLFDGSKNVIGIIEYVRDITSLKKIQDMSHKLKKRIDSQKQVLIEQESAIKVLFREKEKEAKKIARNILRNINLLILPLVQELKSITKNERDAEIIKLIEVYLKNIREPLLDKIPVETYNLTPRESQILSLIKSGTTSKDISSILGISEKSVNFHRLNIRKKLNLTKKNINLHTYLINLQGK